MYEAPGLQRSLARLWEQAGGDLELYMPRMEPVVQREQDPVFERFGVWPLVVRHSQRWP